MKRIDKMAHDHIRKMDPDLPQTRPEEMLDFALKKAYIAGFRAAREMAAAKIKASVNLSGIENPSIELINCSLQAKHDHDLCLRLGEEEV